MLFGPVPPRHMHLCMRNLFSALHWTCSPIPQVTMQYSANITSSAPRYPVALSSNLTSSTAADELIAWIRRSSSLQVYGQIAKMISRSNMSSTELCQLADGIQKLGLSPWLLGMNHTDVYATIHDLVHKQSQHHELQQVHYILGTVCGFDIAHSAAEDQDTTPRPAPLGLTRTPPTSHEDSTQQSQNLVTNLNETEIQDQLVYWIDHITPKEIFDRIMQQFTFQGPTALWRRPHDLTVFGAVLETLDVPYWMTRMTPEEVHTKISRKLKSTIFPLPTLLQLLCMFAVECGFNLSRAGAVAADLTIDHCIRCHCDYREVHNLLGNCGLANHDAPKSLSSGAAPVYWYDCCQRRSSELQFGDCVGRRHVARTAENVERCFGWGCTR